MPVRFEPGHLDQRSGARTTCVFLDDSLELRSPDPPLRMGLVERFGELIAGSHRGEIKERASDLGHWDPVADAVLGAGEARGMEHEPRAAPSLIAGQSDVHVVGLGWIGKELPEAGSAHVTQDRPGPGCQNGAELDRSTRSGGMPDKVDAAMNAVQPAAAQPTADPALANAQSQAAGA